MQHRKMRGVSIYQCLLFDILDCKNYQDDAKSVLESQVRF